MSIEKNIEKLNQLTKTLEQDASLTIDQGLKLFEESIKLAKSCIDEINKKKGDLQLLTDELKKITSNDVICDE